MPGPHLNWLAILAASPVLLALRLTTTPRRGRIVTQRDRRIDIGYGALVSFVYAWILALAIASSGASSVPAGVGYGAAAYAGIRLLQMFFYAGFEEARTLAWWYRTGIQLASYALLGAMYVLWR